MEFQIIPGKVRPLTPPRREPSTGSDHCSLAGQSVLFEDEANTGPLQDELAHHFAGRTVTVEEVCQYVVTKTPFHSGQVKVKTLKPMQAAERISSPNQNKKWTFPDGTLIEFPAAND